MMNTSPAPRQKKSHKGQVLVMFAASLLVFTGFLALAIDVGFLLTERRGIQNAADAAAMAAARDIARGGNAGTAQAAAQSYATSNEYANGGATSVVVQVNGDDVEVEIDHDVQSFFLQAIYQGDWNVSSRAAASVLPDPSPFAMIALGEDPNCGKDTGVTFQGNASTLITGGGIGSNACVEKIGQGGGAGSIFIGGNVEAFGEIDDPGNRIKVETGYHKTGQMNYIEDPYAHVNAPSCSQDGTFYEEDEDEEDEEENSGPGNSGGNQGGGGGNNGPHILEPGNWGNDFPDKGEVNLLPGVYCISSKIKLNGGALVRSVDEDFPDTGDVGNGGGVILNFVGNGSLELAGNGDIQVRSLGFYNANFADCTNACDENIVVFSESCADIKLRGNGASFFTGILYAPCSFLTLGGTSSGEDSSGQVVADAVEIFGNADFNLFADEDYLATPLRVYLIE